MSPWRRVRDEVCASARTRRPLRVGGQCAGVPRLPRRRVGRPVHGERAPFERITLEAFQSGLSWLTILRKRDGFRAAFAGFDPDVVAAYGSADEARLLADPAIVRNRAKIAAAVTNARAVVALRADGGLRCPRLEPPTGEEPRAQVARRGPR